MNKEEKQVVQKVGENTSYRAHESIFYRSSFAEPSGKGVLKFPYETTTAKGNGSRLKYSRFCEQNNSFGSTSRFVVHVLPSLHNYDVK